MPRKAQQAQATEQEGTRPPEHDPLTEALAAMPWERTDEQRLLIIQAGADVRLASMQEDQRKLRERPL
jgi:hypothetical protein